MFDFLLGVHGVQFLELELEGRRLMFRSKRAHRVDQLVRVRFSIHEKPSRTFTVPLIVRAVRAVSDGYVCTGDVLENYRVAYLFEEALHQERPPDASLRQRRRLPFRTLVRSRQLPGFHGITLDFSRDGLQIETEGPVAVGTELCLTVQVGGSSPREFEAAGLVVWCREAARRRYAVGIRFVGADPEQGQQLEGLEAFLKTVHEGDRVQRQLADFDRFLREAEPGPRKVARRVPLPSPQEPSGNRERELAEMAFEDPLTGLPNFTIFLRQLEFSFKQVVCFGRSIALLCLDPDRYAVVNRVLGHDAGDGLLRALVGRCRALAGPKDTLARLNEDRFLVLLETSAQELSGSAREGKTAAIKRRARSFAERLQQAMEDPFPVEGQELNLTVSIGISTLPGDAETPDALLEHARLAARHAKETGRGRIQFYDDALKDRLDRRRLLHAQLPEAIHSPAIRLFYQPIVELSSREIVGVEALLRWDHPELGLILPADFLPVAEASGLMVQLNERVVREACGQLRRWKEEGLDLFVAVNLSPRLLLPPALVTELLDRFRAGELRPADLVLDIPEWLYALDPERVQAAVYELGHRGVRMAVDDYGRGLSSLRSLGLVNTRILKVDQSVVAEMPGNRQAMAISVAAIKIAGSLNMQSLAEGVETEAQYQYLLKNDCDLAQGHYFSPPVEPGGIPGLVRRGRTARIAPTPG